MPLAHLRQFPLVVLGLAALAAAGASATDASAQAQDDAALLGPNPYGGLIDPPTFKSPAEPRKYGLAPGSGAGATGFDSSNRRKKKKPRRGIVVKELPPLAVAPQDATLAPVYRQQPNPVARYTRPGAGPLTRDVVATGVTIRRPLQRKEEEDPFAQPGFRSGAFLLKPALEVTGGHDSNPGRLPQGPSSSFLQVQPELTAKSEWIRHELNVVLKGGYVWYEAVPNFDRSNFNLRANGRIDISRDTRAELEGRLTRTADSPGDPNLPSSVAKPPVINSGGATAGLAHDFGGFILSAKGRADRTTYGDATLNSGAVLLQTDRNYDQYGGVLRGTYDMSPTVKPFVEVGTDRRVHDLAVDFSGVQRDSRGQTVKAGATFDFTRKLTGEASIGYASREYQDPRLPRLRALIGDASLIWYATPLMTAKFTAKSSVEESTIIGVSGILHRDGGVEVEHAFRRWLIGSVKFGYGVDTFEGDTREDRRISGAVALTYKVNRELHLKGEVRRERLRSTVPGADYTANVLMFGLRWQP